METAFIRQLLGGKNPLAGDRLVIQADEMVNAQAVDVGVIGEAPLGKVLAQIIAVCPDGLGELGEGEVVLQEKMLFFAVLFQQRADAGGDGWRCSGGGLLRILCRRCDGRRVFVQLLQRFHAPQQQPHDYEIVYLQKIDENDIVRSAAVEHEKQQEQTQNQQALPNLLVLKIRVVVPQPAAIAPDGEEHI